jgi:hypothetical protein
LPTSHNNTFYNQGMRSKHVEKEPDLKIAQGAQDRLVRAAGPLLRNLDASKEKICELSEVVDGAEMHAFTTQSAALSLLDAFLRATDVNQKRILACRDQIADGEKGIFQASSDAACHYTPHPDGMGRPDRLSPA